MTLHIRPVGIDSEALEKYAALFQATFPVKDRINAAYVRWLYVDNPEGRAIGYDAWDDERLAAHYITIPLRARLSGRERQLVLSLNTATHPDYQGRGLFTTLANATYETAASRGIAGVIGVANANSTPGFIRRLGFQHVRTLRAAIGIGALAFDPQAIEAGAQGYMRLWSEPSLKWRMSNPRNRVFAASLRNGAGFFSARTGIPGILAATERPMVGGHVPASALPFSPLRVFLGLTPPAVRLPIAYREIPQRLRSSPLNLIYKPLAVGETPTLAADEIFFDFLDFDAF